MHNLPITNTAKHKEWETILTIARNNGYLQHKINNTRNKITNKKHNPTHNTEPKVHNDKIKKHTLEEKIIN